MNPYFKALCRTPDRAFRHVARSLINGRTLNAPSFNSMTLEGDDVALASHWLRHPEKWNGYEISREFAARFAAWNGSAFAFAFLGGRVALSAIIEALELKPGDEVIVPGYTCVVVTNSFRFAGVKVIFADIELDTYGLDFEAMRRAVTSRTRAILVHHLYGLVARDVQQIVEFARTNGFWVIEDAAQATGAILHGKKVGNFGDVAFTSTEQSKLLNTIQGGFAVTNRPDLASRLSKIWEQAPGPGNSHIERQLITVKLYYYTYKHSLRWLLRDPITAKYTASRLPAASTEEYQGKKPADYGARMPDPVAALGLNQLKKIDRFNALRRESATHWDKWCDQRGLKKPVVIPGSTPVFLRYPVLVEPRQKKDPAWAEAQLGIRPGVWFQSHVHPSPEVVAKCPNADKAVECCVNLPCLRF